MCQFITPNDFDDLFSKANISETCHKFLHECSSDVAKSIIKKITLLYHVEEVSFAGYEGWFNTVGKFIFDGIPFPIDQTKWFKYKIVYFDRKHKKQIYLFN